VTEGDMRGSFRPVSSSTYGASTKLFAASALDGPLGDAKMCLWTTPTKRSGSV